LGKELFFWVIGCCIRDRAAFIRHTESSIELKKQFIELKELFFNLKQWLIEGMKLSIVFNE